MGDLSDRVANKVVVLGANGRLGAALVQAFAAGGWQVVAQLRRAPRQPLPVGVTELRCDALDQATLQPAARGAAVLVNALNPDYIRWAELLPPITQASLALARASGATLMLPGNVYNFGHALPAVLHEDTPFVANTAKAAQRIALEAALQQAAVGPQPVRSVVLRAGDFLGDAGTWLDLGLGRALARGRFLHMGPTDLPHAWAYLPDLAQAFVAVAAQRDRLPAFACLHFSGHTLSSAQFFDAFAAAWQARGGQPLRPGRFPWWALQLAACVPARPGAMPRALLAMRYLWQRPHQLAGQRLAALIGTAPHTPLAEVMAACLDHLPPALQPVAPPVRQLAVAGQPPQPGRAG